ncbi:MAG: flagellar protein FlgN [Magnetococcus sp. WYHC-3]
MDRYVAELKKVLEPLCQRFEGLHALFQEERGMLTARRADDLEAMAQRIRAELEEVARLEKRRRQLVEVIAARLKLTSKQPTLLELDQALGGGSGLPEWRARLLDRVERAEKVNRDNLAAFKGVMSANEAVMGVLTGSRKESLYNRHGYRQQGISGGYSLFSRQL